MKNLQYTYIKAAITAVLLIFILNNCSKGRQEYTSKHYKKIRNAVITYRARNYTKAKKQFKKLLENDIVTGDILYYYGFIMYKEKKLKKAHYFFKKAIEWFSRYKSEFPEDKNYQKAFYNLGILYYEFEKSRDLQKVKKIWQTGLQHDSNNRFIKNEYDKLLLKIDFKKFRTRLAAFIKSIKNADNLAELKRIKKKYESCIAQKDLSKYNGLPEYQENKREIRDVVYNFDKLIKNKQNELILK